MADENSNTGAPVSESSAPEPGPRPGGRPSGPRGGQRPSGPGGGREGGGRKFFRRKKVCKFCTEKIDNINYKDVRLLSQFVAESGKIIPRRLTGVCTPHQRRVTEAIKQARNIALLPFAARR
jgi:small subunit ribosomal protein S18